MKNANIDLRHFSGTCGDGHHFTSVEASPFDYGRSLLRTQDNQCLAIMDSFEDTLYDEVKALMEGILSTPSFGAHFLECFQRVLPRMYDPAPSGESYLLGQLRFCPTCGTKKLMRYGPDEPPLIETRQLSLGTHALWDLLTSAEKRERVRLALQTRDCLP